MVWRLGGVLAMSGLLAVGCNVDLKAVEYEDLGGHGDDGCHDTYPAGQTAERSCVPPLRDLDILFVIDDSPSMRDEQARIAASFAALIDRIDDEDIDVGYRIGITTTDNGNPWCGALTTPTAGQLLLSSCRERLDDFVDRSENPAVDVSAPGCTDLCPYTGAELEARMLPTTTDEDPEPRVRPWIERIDGVSNLPPEVSPADALACFGPQGVGGCGFESHMESMYKALRRSRDSREDAYGFMRQNANLLVVFVTDEIDCSYRNEYASIFTPEGDHVFWSDPDTATSGICWNAGVLCLGGPGEYDDCVPANRGLDGLVVDDPDLAVLHPVERYADFLDGLEQQRQQQGPPTKLFVSVVGGVPPGYELGGVPIPFHDDPDPELQAQHGIGASCSSDDGAQTARPPVRLHALAQSRGERGQVSSICADDFLGALDPALASLDHPRPACYTDCVADTDPQAPGLQPSCLVEATFDGHRERVVPCALIDDAYALPADDVDICYGYLTDPERSDPAFDDMSKACIEDGWNLEFELVHRSMADRPSMVTAECEPSAQPETDCGGA